MSLKRLFSWADVKTKVLRESADALEDASDWIAGVRATGDGWADGDEIAERCDRLARRLRGGIRKERSSD